jgi:hypothetical protein
MLVTLCGLLALGFFALARQRAGLIRLRVERRLARGPQGF